jgi:hypothetical protein
MDSHAEASRSAECCVKIRAGSPRLQTLNIERRPTMKRICSITLLAFLFLAGNCFALDFFNLEVVSENREVEGWYFGSNILIQPPSSSYDASVSFELDPGTYTKPLTYLEFFSLAVYDSAKLDGDPLLYGGKQVTWTLSNESETISATGMVPIICENPSEYFSPIRRVELAK